MSNRAALYLRSSKDRNDVSIDAQRRALHELATTKNLIVVQEFSDAVESGKDEDRPGFKQLAFAFKDPARGWEHLLVLDTSRVARRRELSMLVEREAEKARITIHYRNLPDSEGVMGTLIKSIMQSIDEWHSMTSREKGLAGMAENVRQGWRAGGRAPRGYKLEYTPTGAIRDGSPVLKSKLEPNEDAPLIASYLQSRAAGESRSTIVQRLGIEWDMSSLVGMEWQALTYAGHTVWNVHNERTKDGYKGETKRKPRAEWIVTRNTHPALITDEDAEAILSQLEAKASRRTRQTDRTYLLSGLLVSPDGQPWHGEWDGKMNAALYRLGKGKKVAARRIDGAVIDAVFAELDSPEVVQSILKEIRELAGPRVDGRAIAGMEKKLDGLTKKIGKLIDFMAEDDGAIDAYRRSIAQAEAERASLIEQLRKAREQAATANEADQLGPDDVRHFLRRIAEDFRIATDEGEIKSVKVALGGLIERIELDPASDECLIHYRISVSDTGFNMASPRGTQLNPVRWTQPVQLIARANQRAA